MPDPTRFSAPWSASLKLLTGVCLLLLLGLPLVGLLGGPKGELWFIAMVVLPPAVLLLAAAFIILGYEVVDHYLIIHRPGWQVRLDLDGLRAVEADPGAMLGSVRTFGNGGLFCFAGWFRNTQLGPYQAYATDPWRAVVLHLSQGTVVISPDDPRRLVKLLRLMGELESDD